MHTTPASLLERLQEPDPQEAWERFVALYTPLLFHWARRMGLASSDASDLVQDVFVLLVQKLPEFSYDPKRRFRGWLWTLMLNKLRENRRCPALAQVVGAENLDDLPSLTEAAEIGEEEYRKHLVQRALELMQSDFQPTTWQACWKNVVEGQPTAVVAVQLGISVGAVRAAKFRVLCRLRTELEGLLD